MALPVIYGLIIAATVLHGLLAGGNVDRALVQMPAWRRTGVRGWAAYSRHADLENGLFLYPSVAIGGALLTLAAAIGFFLNPAAPRAAAVPIYLAVALALGGLAATTQAAPKMLSLRRIGNNPAALQRAFAGFMHWGNVRGLFQVLAFGANMWSLVAVLRGL
jgi:hypothetical protein